MERLAAEGERVTGTFRDVGEDRSWVPEGVVLRRVDLLDLDATARLVEEAQPELVFHLAARSSVAASWREPLATISENAAMQLNLLEAIRKIQPRARVVVVGSCDEYGSVLPKENPVAETHELRPASPYALSKVVQDLMGLQYAEVDGMSIVRVRPFLQLGPRRQSHFVAGSFARQIAEAEADEREPLIEVGNIDVQRDFLDVRDMARAYVAAAERGVPGQVYNVATGRAHTPRDLLDTMLSRSGLQFTVREASELRRKHEPPVVIGDSSRFREATGWSPRISFEQSAFDTLDYWRARVRAHSTSEGDLR